MLDVEKIRKDFPFLENRVNGNQFVYLDSASTSQKPIQVINSLVEYYKRFNANVHRAIYSTAVEATEKFESTREKMAKLLNANSSNEIIFGKNGTEMFNLILHSWAMKNLKQGDEIILTIMEHHSNIVPWQLLQEKGVRIRYVDINEEGELKIDELNEIISKKTRMISFSHVSNVLGTINPVDELCKIAHDNNCVAVVDAVQSVPHMPVDVKKIDPDFLIFSGHKMLGPTGVGGMFAKENILKEMSPFLRGSDQIKEVTKFETTFQDPPHRFETGTPNIEQVIGLGVAVDYLNSIGMENIREHERESTEYALKKMQEIEKVEIYGPKNIDRKGGVISFNIDSVHAHDVSQIANSIGVAIRSGHHCAMPLMNRLGIAASVRASFYLYNTKQEIDRLLDAIKKTKEVFKI